MSQWLTDTIDRAEQANDRFIAPAVVRESSLALLREQVWPNRKTEAWKYTSLFPLANASFNVTNDVSSENVDISSAAVAGLDSIDVVFNNGVLVSSIENLPVGLTITALTDDVGAGLFSSVKPSRHLFGLVNDVLTTSGVMILVAENTVIDKPIRIVNGIGENCEAHTRVLVRVSEGASLTIIEQFVGNKHSLNTGFSEYDVAANATLEHYRFALQMGGAMSVGGGHFNLHENAKLNSTLVGFGSKLSRIDIDVNHLGPHTHAKLNAIYLLDGDELFDLHSTIEHTVANGTTAENVRGIVADRSTAVFNGRIHIHRDAQKTLAELNNRNLLLSRKAQINTKPELEIYADDVKCAHGVTIAEIDKEAMYYLQSRGMSSDQAKVMLNFGFINELVDQMPNECLAQWLRPQLRARFAQMKVD